MQKLCIDYADRANGTTNNFEHKLIKYLTIPKTIGIRDCVPIPNTFPNFHSIMADINDRSHVVEQNSTGLVRRRATTQPV